MNSALLIQRILAGRRLAKISNNLKFFTGTTRVMGIFLLSLAGLAITTSLLPTHAINDGRPEIVWMRGGHLSDVRSMDYSPDGQLFVTMGDHTGTGVVKVWRVSDGMLLRTFDVFPAGFGSALKLLSDGQTMIVVGVESNASTIKSVRVADGGLIWSRVVPGNISGVDLAVTGDGNLFIGGNNGVQFYSSLDGALLNSFNATFYRTSSGTSVSFHGFQDGHLAYNGTVAVSLNTGSGSTRYPAIVNPSDCLTDASGIKRCNIIAYFPSLSNGLIDVTPDGRNILTWGGGNLMNVYPVSHGCEPGGSSCDNPGGPILTGNINPTFSRDGSILATKTSSPSPALYLYHVPSWSLLRIVPVSGSAYNTTVFSPDNQIVANNAFAEGTTLLPRVSFWRVSDGSMMGILNSHFASVAATAFSSDGAWFATGAGIANPYDGVVRIWRANEGTLITSFSADISSVNAIAFSPVAPYVATGGNGGIKLWNVFDGSLIRSFSSNHAHSVAFSPDGTKLLTGGSGSNRVNLWDVHTGGLIRSFFPLAGFSRAVAISPDGQIMAASDGSIGISFWRMSDGSLLRTISTNGTVSSIAFSPDRQTLIAGLEEQHSGGRSSSLKQWQVSDGELIRTFSGHLNWIKSVAFSPDGRTILSGGVDGIRLWDANNGTQLRYFDEETVVYPFSNTSGTPNVLSVSFSPDGSKFGYGRFDATAVVANFPLNQPPVATVGFGKAIIEATSPAGAMVSLDGSQSFDPDGSIVSYKWREGPNLLGEGVRVSFQASLGSHIYVVLEVTDNEGAISSDTVEVTVVDTTAPGLTLPSDFTIPATSSAGAVATFNAAATDIVDGVLTPTCLPPSGSTFPIGQTIVICSATDSRQNNSQGTFTVTVTSPSPSNSCLTPPAGMVSWWPGAGNTNDIHGGNNATLQNGATFGPGIVGQAFNLDGVNDYLSVRDTPSLNLGRHTLGAWIYVKGMNGSFSGIIVKQNPDNRGRNYYLGLTGNNRVLHYSIQSASGQYSFLNGNSSVSLNTWTHVAATYDGTDMTVYVNGIEDARLNVGPLTPAMTSQPLTIGWTNEDPGFGNRYFYGGIDEVQIFTRALDQTEISSIVAAGSHGICQDTTPPVISDLPGRMQFGNWLQITPNGPSPSARSGHRMVYDPHRAKVIMFGGFDSQGNFLNDIWEYDTAAAAWLNITPSAGNMPIPRRNFGMAYDDARQKILIYGGECSTQFSNVGIVGDTWEFDPAARTWTQLSATTIVHVGFYGVQLAYDPNLQTVILFGGEPYWRYPTNGETYAWLGNNWTLVANTGPLGRVKHAMTTDTQRGRVMMFGGYNRQESGFTFPSDTWEWNGQTWSKVSNDGQGPSARDWSTMAYDTQRGVSYLFGGVNKQDTWEWNGSQWNQLTPTTSPSSRATAMVYDTSQSKLVAFSGAGQADVWYSQNIQTLVLEATSRDGAVANYSPTATDDVDGTLPVTCTPSSGSMFPIGLTTVLCSATDSNGNQAQASFNVLVEDTTAPSPDLSVLPDITGQCGATIASAPTATDIAAGSIVGTTTDPLTYNLQGTFSVTWSYNDGRGNVSRQIQRIIVSDSLAPASDVSNLPDLNGQCSVTISNPPTATDNCLGVITGTTSDPLTYTTPGTFEIRWSYNDGHGNISTQIQKVTVTSPPTTTEMVSPGNPSWQAFEPPGTRVAVTKANARNGVGSLELTGSSGLIRSGSPLGTYGNLKSLKFDWYIESFTDPTLGTRSLPPDIALRIYPYGDPRTFFLHWDTCSPATGCGSYPVGSWETTDLIDRLSIQQAENNTPPASLADIPADAPITEIQARGNYSFGGPWHGFVDNIQIGFACDPSTTYNFEPVYRNNDLVGWWRGEDDSTDSAGFNHGYLQNGATFANGRYGRSFSLDGVNEHVIVTDAASLNVGQHTLGAWIYVKGMPGPYSGIIVKQNPNNTGRNYYLGLTGSRVLHYSIQTSTGQFHFLNSNSSIPANTWTYVAAVYDGNAMRLYINGIEDAALSVGAFSPATTSAPLTIGWTNENDVRYFFGNLDEVQIFKRALTAGEVNAISEGLVAWYQAEGNAEDSARGNDGTIHDNLTFVPGKFGQAFSRDYVTVETSADLETPNFSVSAWVRSLSQGSPGPYNYLIAKGTDTCWSSSYSLSTEGEGGLRLRLYDGANQAHSPDAGTTIWDGNWHKVVGTYDGSYVRLFVDGSEIGNGTPTTIRVKYDLPTTRELLIGAYSASPACRLAFNGDIDDVKIYNRALTALEIRGDTEAPVTTATLSAPANAAGWHNANVTVQLSASDNHDGSGIREVTYSVSGAQTVAPTVVAGDTASIQLTAEGQSTVSYFATDNAGNVGSQQTLTVKIDKSMPIISCGSADNQWHSSDVSIPCAANDAISGLEDSANSNFTLVTSLLDGTENANVSTNSRSICDIAGNCDMAGPITGNKIDKKHPSISINSPVGTDYLLNQVVASSYACTDLNPGTCMGTVTNGANIDTSSLGLKNFIVSAVDAVGNTAQAQVSYNVIPSADLSVVKNDASDPVTMGNNLTYNMSVRNDGPSTATGVTLVDTLPAGLTLVNTFASQGSCSGTSTVTCNLGTLNSFSAATVLIVVRADAAGTFTNTAQVTGNQADPIPANNSSTQVTTVLEPCVLFNNQTTFAVGNGPSAIVVADFNRDFRADVAVANRNSNNVSIRFGNGFGSFGAVTNFAVGSSPRFLLRVDLNRDGRSDLVTANFSSNNVSVLLGNATGGFSPRVNYATGTGPQAITTVDFNGDGRLDLATANSGNVTVLPGNGAGGFGAPVVVFTLSGITAIANGDYNRDGREDIAVASQSFLLGQVRILLNNVNGTFTLTNTYSVGRNPRSLILRHVNGDQYQDLVAASDGIVSLLMGNGTGSFQITNKPVTGNHSAVNFALVNRDAIEDMVLTNSNTNSVSVLLAGGGGNFGNAVNYNVGSSPSGVAVADFNSDGRPDVVVANSASNNFSLLLNTGSCP